MTRLSFFCLALCLVGCAPTTKWVHPYANEFQFQYDSNQCRAWANMKADNGARVHTVGQAILVGLAEGITAEGYYNQCMVAKGYVQVPLEQVATQHPQELPPNDQPISEVVPQVQLQLPLQNQTQNQISKEIPQDRLQSATQDQLKRSAYEEKKKKLDSLQLSHELGEISTEEFARKRNEILAEYR